jgi:hypothetical protein
MTNLTDCRNTLPLRPPADLPKSLKDRIAVNNVLKLVRAMECPGK